MQKIKEIKTAAAYIRVSTDDQAEYSPEAQRKMLLQYAKDNGYILTEENIFIDEGISGKKADNRPEFQKMIASAKSDEHPYDVILLWKFSRFARNQEESIVYKSMLRQDNVDVISITEPIIEGPFGSLIERIIEWMDEYYSIRLAGEVKKGMSEKHRRGELQTTPSFGYAVMNNVLVPNEDEAEIVRQIFQRFVDGEGYFAIAKWLNSIGIKTHRGNAFENRTIEYMIHNPVYIGKLRWNPKGRTKRYDWRNDDTEIVDGKHEALINMSTWEAAQKRALELKQKWRWHGRPSAEAKDWLTGLIRCPNCDSSLLFTGKGYMRCGGYARGQCDKTQFVSADIIRQAILDKLELDSKPSAKIVYTIKQADRLDESERLRSQRDKIQKKIDRLRDAYLAGAESPEDYKEIKKSLEEQIFDINNEIEKRSHVDRGHHEPEIKAALENLLKVLKSTDIDTAAKHTAAHRQIERVYWDKQKNTLQIRYNFFV